jgi:hypothetical protein
VQLADFHDPICEANNMHVRTLVFDQISDSRFSGSQDALIRQSEAVLAEISRLPNVTVKTDAIRTIDFLPHHEELKSWRQRFYVQKTGVRTRWKDIYSAVNRVKAANYTFCQAEVFNSVKEAI